MFGSLKLLGLGLVVKQIDQLHMNHLKFFVLETKLTLFERKVSPAPSPAAFGIDEKKEPYVGKRLILHIGL